MKSGGIKQRSSGKPLAKNKRVRQIESYRSRLEDLYERFNRREWVHPDPLEFLYNYEDIRDREIAGLISALLAYGRVAQILASVQRALERMEHPREFVENHSPRAMGLFFEDFRHRFTTGRALAGLLSGVKRALAEYGSLEGCFRAGLEPGHATVMPALEKMAAYLAVDCADPGCWILPSPELGGACKRLHLYLRWMVRRDAVDPGGWQGVSPSQLVIPVDTHMHRIALALGLTKRKQADRRTALEITEAFRVIQPGDPVKYDFCLTRLGIRSDLDREAFIKSMTGKNRSSVSNPPHPFPLAREREGRVVPSPLEGEG